MRSFGLNTVSNVAARIWSMFAVYFFVPFYVHILGESAYGLVSFFAILHTLLNILGLGLSNTLRREFAVGKNCENNDVRKYKLLRSVELFYFGIGIVIVFICACGSNYISTKWLNIEALDSAMVSKVIALMGMSIALQLVANMYAGCLFGLEHQVQANFLCIAWSFAKNVGALGVIALIAPDLRLFYLWHIIVDFVYLVAIRMFVIKYLRKPQWNLWKLNDLKNLSSIWKYTLGLLFISLIALVNRQFDKVIISKFLTLTELGAYNAATTLGNLTSIIPSAIYIAIFPMFTKAATTNNIKTLIEKFRIANKIVNIVVSCMMAFISVFSVQIVKIWTGSEIYAGVLPTVGCLVVLAVGITEFQEIPYALVLAHGNTKINVLVGGAFIPIVALSTFWGIKNYGLIGAGFVYLTMSLLQTVLYEHIVYKKYVDVNPLYLIFTDSLIPLFFSLVLAFVCSHFVCVLTESVTLQVLAAVVSGFFSLVFLLFLLSRKELSRIKYFNQVK